MSLRSKPWWTPDAVKFVDKLLTKESKVLEFGSGGSTPWLCDRSRIVVSIEDNSRWFKLVSQTKKSNLDFRLMKRPYHTVCNGFEGETFDFIMVDGRDRVKCFLSALQLLKSGGWIGLDDAPRARYEEAHNSVSGWEQVKLKNNDPREERTGSRHTWFWKKPEK